jgi:hypothetical protein
MIPSPPSQADGTPQLERTGEAKTIDTNFKRAAADVPPEGDRMGAVVVLYTQTRVGRVRFVF